VNNGTPSFRQYNTVIVGIVAALPRALEILDADPKRLLSHMKDNTQGMSVALASMLEGFMDGRLPSPAIAKAASKIFGVDGVSFIEITPNLVPHMMLRSVNGGDISDALEVDSDLTNVIANVIAESNIPSTSVKVGKGYLSCNASEGQVRGLNCPKFSAADSIYLLASEMQKVVNRVESEIFEKDEVRRFFIVGSFIVVVSWFENRQKWYIDLVSELSGTIYHEGDILLYDGDATPE
jgi:hypothetical protein